MKLNWPHESMTRRVMMLGVVAAKILNSRPPVDDELALVGPVLNPIKTYVYYLISFLFDFIVGNPTTVVLSTCIVIGGWGCPIYSSTVRIGMDS